jgi:hypothetical protein
MPLFIATLLFATEVLIACHGGSLPWLRGFFGDVLAVMLVYYGLSVWVDTRVLCLALVALGVGCAVELGQYVALVNHWSIANPVLRIVLGSTPDWWDVLAYGIGFAMVLAFEWAVVRHRRETRSSVVDIHRAERS